MFGWGESDPQAKFFYEKQYPLNKAELRVHYKSIRDNLAVPAKDLESKQCCSLLSTLLSFLHVETLHAFIPLSHEIDINPLIDIWLKERKQIVVPKTEVDGLLTHWLLSDRSQLVTGLFDTEYPVDAHAYLGDPDAILVPGLAFDQRGHRLGYGAGYYDQFLVTSQAVKIGVHFSCQLSEPTLPHEEHDIAMDFLVSNRILFPE